MPPDASDVSVRPARASVSLLSPDASARPTEGRPACFDDLSLDQVVAAVTTGREPYELAGIFNAPLRDPAAVTYRQAVFRDFETAELKAAFETFAAAMVRSREAQAHAGEQRHAPEHQRWVVTAVLGYCRGVAALVTGLKCFEPTSEALKALAAFGAEYVASEAFASMRERTEAVAAQLSVLRYTVQIQGLDVRVAPFADETDYGAAIAADFARFAQGEGEHFPFVHDEGGRLNMIEERILDHVALAYPDVFAELTVVAETYGGDFVDPVVARIDREAQFYLGWRALIDPIAAAGHAFCYPEVTTGKAVFVDAGFDLALAHVLGGRNEPLVPNSFRLDEGERIIVVSGPNQGGKTTFARMFGQLHYFAALGLPVPGRAARLHLFDAIFTHFERRELSATAHGKLEDELVRLHAILEAATGDSIVVLNELFASTTFRDATLLSDRTAAQLLARGVIGVWVSFLDELAGTDPAMVSMVSQVDPDDPAHRTFKVERRPADGLAYARAIARKHGLTREQIDRRLGTA